MSARDIDIAAFVSDYAWRTHPVIVAAFEAKHEWRRLPIWRRLWIAGVGRGRRERRARWIESRADAILSTDALDDGR